MTMDPKAALPQSLNTVPDTSTLGTPLSSLSLSEQTNESSPPGTTYQVFILAGFGHGYTPNYIYLLLTRSLYPLTEEDNLPKALLPIANTPLLYYPLEWCSKAGFRGRSFEYFDLWKLSLWFVIRILWNGYPLLRNRCHFI
jgi:hypothetical protein